MAANEEAVECEGEVNIAPQISFDDEGDALLEVADLDMVQRIPCRVSTKVLSLASPVFAKLFGPDFKEGRSIRSGQLDPIFLEEDDAQVMKIILGALHYKGIKEIQSVDAECLASIAIHCDKYNCVSALSPWLSYWFGKITPLAETSEELGFLLLAAYKCDDAEKFKEMSRRALRKFTPVFGSTWGFDEKLSFFPDSFQDIIIKRIEQLLGTLHTELQSVETKLRQNRTGFKMQLQSCVHCGRTPPAEAKRCHPCNNPDLYPKYCTGESRASDFFSILEKAKLWPSVKPFQACSLAELLARLESAKRDTSHSCMAGDGCPLKRELNGLYLQWHLVHEGVSGFCLTCMKKNDWTEIKTCNLLDH
ncbi:hypothetical protein B0O99DRAFT_682550 [Bisporella sp. PMI_857]|nr:hypothetical protein B0O99DRAFT_682550 [Bisporella sp. PMI_857]